MEILLIKLFIAHILGDFFFQPDIWVKDKELKKLRSLKLYLHILIHGILIMLLVWKLNFWPEALILMILHGFTDILKLFSQKEKTKRIWFFIDQALHILSILAIWYCSVQPVVDFSFLNSTQFWIFLGVILSLTFPSSIIIRVLIAKWTPNSTGQSSYGAVASLQSAGKYIGIMERLLVFLFIYTNHFEAVGFLIAAKSIFRFGDLKEGNDLKLTEYILIGTFLSFGIAVSISLIASSLIR